ncbi:MAG TPA: histone deacetylase [Anaerolineales bacterium]|nr:histone deacetylase [Anaerolineales bacterium]
MQSDTIPDLVYFDPIGHEAHYAAGHPERPERIEAIRQGLQSQGLWEPYPHLAPRQIPREILEKVHTPQYLRQLENACWGGEWLDMDTYTSPASWVLALNAAGGALAVAETVWQSQAWRGFALARPPGHHACSDRGMGFCLLNNVAIAAEGLIQAQGARRLAIVDLDLHHGNGTQEIFYERSDVFYISTHQTPLFPGSGAIEEMGFRAGQGFTANLPLPPGAGDSAFSAGMEHFILPLLEKYHPEALLVSIGFDVHWRDPLGSLQLSAEGQYRLIRSLTQFADLHCAGHIALFLEGGYDLQASSVCAQASVAGLLNLPFHDLLGPAPGEEGEHWQVWLERARKQWGL